MKDIVVSMAKLQELTKVRNAAREESMRLHKAFLERMSEVQNKEAEAASTLAPFKASLGEARRAFEAASDRLTAAREAVIHFIESDE